MFTSYDKAIASFFGTMLPLLAAFGLKLPISTETIVAITPFISMILTWLVPNLPSPSLPPVVVAVPSAPIKPGANLGPPAGIHPGTNAPG